MTIHLAETDADIDRCFATMAQLRPRLQRDAFVDHVRRLMTGGYQLAYVEHENAVVAVAGFRLGENLAWGRHVYVDDLVTDADCRSAGHGQAMLDWLIDFARTHNCDSLHLDSGVERFDAHRFYLRNKMRISSHHFALTLGE